VGVFFLRIVYSSHARGVEITGTWDNPCRARRALTSTVDCLLAQNYNLSRLAPKGIAATHVRGDRGLGLPSCLQRPPVTRLTKIRASQLSLVVRAEAVGTTALRAASRGVANVHCLAQIPQLKLGGGCFRLGAVPHG
jgi:hypothetical protein